MNNNRLYAGASLPFLLVYGVVALLIASVVMCICTLVVLIKRMRLQKKEQGQQEKNGDEQNALGVQDCDREEREGQDTE